MGMFLNSSIPYEAYKEVLLDKYFVDKSMLIGELILGISYSKETKEHRCKIEVLNPFHAHP